MSIFDRITRPTLLLDRQTTVENIALMAGKAASQGVRFRPHFKTHQSAVIGEWFRPFGVEKITVSSVGMAEYFARAGWQDITIAFSCNLREMDAIRTLAEKVHLGLLIESPESLAALKEKLNRPADLWIKIDAGAGRTGLAWDQPEAVAALAHAAQSSQPLHLRGLLTHAGHTYQARSNTEIIERYSTATQRLIQMQQKLAALGLAGLELSVGDTPGCTISPDLGAVSEIRPGNFVFYDATQTVITSCLPQQVAVALACPVVAKHPDRSEVIIYGGAVHLSKDFYEHAGIRSYGLVCEPAGERWGAPLTGAYVRGLSQEHGLVHLQPADFDRVHIGDLLCILPSHSCLTVQVMGSYLTLDGEEIPIYR